MTNAKTPQKHLIEWMPMDDLPKCATSLRITYERLQRISKETGGKISVSAGVRVDDVLRAMGASKHTSERTSLRAAVSDAVKGAPVQNLHIGVTWENPYRMADVFLLACETQHTVTLTVRDSHANYKADSHDGVVAAFRAYSNPRRVERIAAKINRLITTAVGTPAQDGDGGGA